MKDLRLAAKIEADLRNIERGAGTVIKLYEKAIALVGDVEYFSKYERSD